MQALDATAPTTDTRVAGVAMTHDAMQLVFGWGTLQAMGRSAQVCRFFRATTDRMVRAIATFKMNVNLLKTMPILSDTDNMFDSQDVPTVLRTRYELINKLVAEEKALAAKGADTSTKRIMLRSFATRYAALGDVNHTLALLIEVDLCSLKLVAEEKDVFTKADRLSRVIDVMSQVVNFVQCYEHLLLRETLQSLNECVAQTLRLIEPLKQCKFGQYNSFDDVIKQSRLEDAYAQFCAYARNPIIPSNDVVMVSSVGAAAAATSVKPGCRQ